ncbi:hypothetical protein FA10DRAFT_263385 [Acaromyces ingoldii]|uniref:Zn(2)-C6 fungal-type domain-containing protein n=1 Tax=Acaromyces ingoldii TaxID=215250 RepID=A0A316YTJ5_9BASI|nr:hypothetical protein FA10DRAFT_263385 [Acaromyces ingoldii]PWN92609.1 hypothetical protein FA10DRAFT_263385 [Acaromyces ingoldii]
MAASSVQQTADVVSGSSNGATPGARKPRTARACNCCRQRRAKCDGKFPLCARCDRLKIRCRWPDEYAQLQEEEQRRRQEDADRIRWLESGLSHLLEQISPTTSYPASTLAAGRGDNQDDQGGPRPRQRRRLSPATAQEGNDQRGTRSDAVPAYSALMDGQDSSSASQVGQGNGSLRFEGVLSRAFASGASRALFGPVTTSQQDAQGNSNAYRIQQITIAKVHEDLFGDRNAEESCDIMSTRRPPPTVPRAFEAALATNLRSYQGRQTSSSTDASSRREASVEGSPLCDQFEPGSMMPLVIAFSHEMAFLPLVEPDELCHWIDAVFEIEETLGQSAVTHLLSQGGQAEEKLGHIVFMVYFAMAVANALLDEELSSSFERQLGDLRRAMLPREAISDGPLSLATLQRMLLASLYSLLSPPGTADEDPLHLIEEALTVARRLGIDREATCRQSASPDMARRMFWAVYALERRMTLNLGLASDAVDVRLASSALFEDPLPALPYRGRSAGLHLALPADLPDGQWRGGEEEADLPDGQWRGGEEEVDRPFVAAAMSNAASSPGTFTAREWLPDSEHVRRNLGWDRDLCPAMIHLRAWLTQAQEAAQASYASPLAARSRFDDLRCRLDLWRVELRTQTWRLTPRQQVMVELEYLEHILYVCTIAAAIPDAAGSSTTLLLHFSSATIRMVGRLRLQSASLNAIMVRQTGKAVCLLVWAHRQLCTSSAAAPSMTWIAVISDLECARRTFGAAEGSNAPVGKTWAAVVDQIVRIVVDGVPQRHAKYCKRALIAARGARPEMEPESLT